MRVLVRGTVLAVCVFVSGTVATAQTRPVWQQKIDYLNNGPAGYASHPGGYAAYSAGTRLFDARQYSQQLYDYAQCAPAQPLQPAVTKTESEHIGQTIQAAKQNLAVVKKEAEKVNDTTITKKLELVDKHLNAAIEHHKKMHMECCKDSVDSKAMSHCCDELMTELDKAIAEHASLMRQIGATHSAAAPSATPKK